MHYFCPFTPLSSPLLNSLSFLLRLHLLFVLAFLLFYAYKAALLLLNRREQLRAVRARTRLADSVLVLLALVSGGTLLALYPGPVPGGLWLKLGLLLVLLPLAVLALRRQFRPGVVAAFLALVGVYGVGETGGLALGPAAVAPSPASYSGGLAEAAATPDAAPPVDTAAVVATSGTSAATPAPDGSATTPAGAGADAASPPADPVAVAAAEPTEAGVAGKVLYAQYCTPCHGNDGRKGLGGAYDLTKSNLNATGRVYQITNGSLSKKMPAFKGQLTEQQIQAVADYSLTLK